MRHFSALRLVLAGLCALVPGSAAAQSPPPGMGMGVPGAESFTIRYYVTNADGSNARTMQKNDFNQFVNQARCQCGHKIFTQILLKATMSGYNQSTQVDTMVGTMCATAESAPAGQFRRCGGLDSQPISQYVKGIGIGFHPVWLSNGVAISSDSRNVIDGIAAGKCEGVFGEAGVWMCAQTNGATGCQSDEFFIQGTQNINIGMGGIKYDFVPPLTDVQDVRVATGDGAVVLSWDIQVTGDINGYRVLCEEADTGNPVPGKAQPAPDLTAIPNGTFFYTKDNMCPGGPFSTFVGGEDDPIVDIDTDTAGTDTDTGGSTGGTGGSTGASTGGSAGGSTGGSSGVIPPNCSDGVLDMDEECDDGADNGDTKACLSNCSKARCGDGFVQEGVEECDLGDGSNGPNFACSAECKANTSPGMAALDWKYVCTGHIAYNSRSVRIDGLDNGKKYNFRLVTYDLFGNPRPAEEVLTAVPVETNDLWEQCYADGACGDAGFCNVSGRSGGLAALAAFTGLSLGALGVARRRRKRA